MTLTGRLILTKGLKTAVTLMSWAHALVQRVAHERALALFIVCAAALLSTFLTNDVVLFILVPLTLTLRKFSLLPISCRIAPDAGR